MPVSGNFWSILDYYLTFFQRYVTAFFPLILASYKSLKDKEKTSFVTRRAICASAESFAITLIYSEAVVTMDLLLHIMRPVF